MKKFLQGVEIEIKDFFCSLYISCFIIFSAILLLEALFIVGSDAAGYFPVISMFGTPVLLWIFTQIQFFRHKKYLQENKIFKIMWILAGIPITFLPIILTPCFIGVLILSPLIILLEKILLIF